jgi:RNA polymerase sigma factor (sigma-70 family)
MTDRRLQTVLQHARKLVTAEMPAALSDHELLQRFVQSRDEAAFTALVQRHAALVLGVCRRVLKHGHDAEDATQATFLVLARRATSIRKHSALGSWLYGVAYRLARKIQTGEVRRRARETRARCPTISSPDGEASWREVQVALDEELMSLPEKYRAPLVLCYLEERTRDEAAAQLGLLLSTLRGRLEQGRERLRTRLTRRGITLSAALLVPALADASMSGLLSPNLVVSTVRAALGRSAGLEASRAAFLAEGAVNAMSPSMMKTAMVFFLILGLAVGGGAIVYQICAAANSDGPPELARALDPDEPKKPATVESRRDLCGDPLPPGAIARLGTVRFRPGSFLTSVAFTPDGKQLASHGPWSGVNVWDAVSGKEMRRLTAVANDWIGAALLTPDGQSFVTLEGVGQKTFIRIRDRAELKVTRAFPVGAFMHSPRLTPNGKLIALASNGNDITVEVWDLKDGKQMRSWKAHEGHVWCIDLSRDGKTLATGGADKTIRVWDVTTGRLIRELTGNPNVVGNVAVSPDGNLVASLGMTEVKSGNASVFAWDNRIRIWDVATGKEMRQVAMEAKSGVYGHVDGHPPGFTTVAFSPDGKALTTAGEDGWLRLWDPVSGKQQRQFALVLSGVVSLAFAPDGQTLAIGGSSIRLLDLATGKDKLPQFGHLLSIHSVAFSSDGRTVATGAEGQIQLWDAQTGKPGIRLDGHEKTVTSLRISGDGRTLLSGSIDRTLRLWDLDTGKERRRLDAPNIGFAAPAVTQDGATVALVNDDKAIRLVDLATGKDRQRLPAGDERVAGAAFTPDGRSLIVWHADHRAVVWDVAAGKKVRQFEFAETRHPVPRPVPPGGNGGRSASYYIAAASPDGRLVAYANQDNFLAVHEVATGKPVRLVENLADSAGTLAFSPDGRSLAWSGWRQPVIHLLELATGKERIRFDGHKGGVTALAFTANGRTLVSGSGDTTALVWDLTNNLGSNAGLLDVDAAWRDLASGDAEEAFGVMRRLASSPKDAVALVRQRVFPIRVPDEKRLAKLIADLDSDQFELRAAAQRELEKHGETAVHAYRAALQRNPTIELRRRLEGLDEQQTREIWSPGPERLRALRAVEVLELAGTPEARGVLKTLAEGALGAQLTEEAKSSQLRLANRPAATTTAPNPKK